MDLNRKAWGVFLAGWIGTTLSPCASAKIPAQDAAYLKFIETKLSRLDNRNPQKMLFDYARYLETGHPWWAEAYILKVRKWSGKNKIPINGVEIFEGDKELCLMENDTCQRSVGNLTREYFLPRVQRGDRAALEILFLQVAIESLDGAEGRAFGEFLFQNREIFVKYNRKFEHIKKKYKKFLEKLNGRWEAYPDTDNCLFRPVLTSQAP